MKPLFSIIILSFNNESTIEKAIKSALNQNFENFEIILIDDSSTDNSKKVIKKYKKEIEILFNNKNQGISYSRNEGLRKSAGDYILFLDGDDFLEPDFLEKFSLSIDNDNADLIVCSFNTIINKTKIKNIFKKQYYQNKNLITKRMLENFDNHMLYNVWNKCYKKSIIKTFNITFDENKLIGEDLKFNQEYLLKINTLSVIEKPLYNYVKSPKSTMNTYHENLFEIRLKENEEFVYFFEKNKIQNYQHFLAKRFLERIYSCFVNLMYKENKLGYNEKYSQIKKITNHTKTKEYLKIFNGNSLKMKILLFFVKHKCYSIIYFVSKLLSIIKNTDFFYKFKKKL